MRLVNSVAQVSIGCGSLVVAVLLSSIPAKTSIASAPDESAVVGPSANPTDFLPLFISQIVADRSRLSMGGAMAGVPGADVPLGGWNEPAIAVNPTNALNIAYASLFELRVSTDGGTTWQEPVPSSLPISHVPNGDPSLAFDSQGRLYWTYLGMVLGSYLNFLGGDVFIAQCDPTTGEVLPGYPINVTAGIGLPGSAGNGHDKQWVAADFDAASPFADQLYLVWSNFVGTALPVTLTTRSSDQGMTWSSALQLGTASGFGWPAHCTTALNGDVYMAYHRQPLFSGGAPNGVSGHVRLFRSTNGGLSYVATTDPFTAGLSDMTFNRQTATGTIPGTDFLLQGSVQPWVLADPNVPGRIYVVANDDPDNNVTTGDAANVFIVRSTDNGTSWSAPMRVDRGPGTTFQVMPTASIDPATGTIVVHYYDNRNGVLNANGNFLLDVFAAVSIDGGSSFGYDFQINDVPFDPDAGARCRYDCGTWLSDVWTDVGGDAFAVSLSGDFLSYDGSNWVITTATGVPKFAIWGSSPTDVFLCGTGGTIMHFDGSQLIMQTSNTTSDLFGLDGRSGSDVFAVGAGGTVVHYDGANWSPLSSGSASDLHDVWVNPTGNVFIAGDAGTVLEYDGSWADRSIGTDDNLWGVWGSGDDDVYISAASIESGRPALRRWDGTSWNAIDTDLAMATGVWGSSMNNVLALGFGRIRRFDGSIWSPDDASEHILWKLHGSGPSNVFAVGENGSIAHYDGSNWTSQVNPLMAPLPTKRVGEYNGVASGGGRSFAVWCGNTFSESLYGGATPYDQQTIFDDFQTDWQTGISVVDLMHHATDITLEPATPNPVHLSTTVAYSLPQSETVDLSVVDVQGRRVATLVHGRQPSGRHVALWNGQSVEGQTVAAGVYFLRLSAGGTTRAQRVTLMP